MRPEFMTSTSCDSVYCMCGAAWSSHRLMTQLTNDKRACVVVFVPVADILNTLCDYQLSDLHYITLHQFVLSVLDELYVSRHA